MTEKYKIKLITSRDHSRRAVAFLISSEENITAKSVFDSLKNTKSERILLSWFDAWVDGLKNDNWYHGWNQTQYTGRYVRCFVFKYREKRLEQRFYGFLCNPKTKLPDQGFQLCVLIRHGSKSQWETDENDLRIVEEIRTRPAVQKVIYDYFKEKP